MSIPGRRTCMCKGMKALGIFRDDKKLNIDGMWGCSGEGGFKAGAWALDSVHTLPAPARTLLWAQDSPAHGEHTVPWLLCFLIYPVTLFTCRPLGWEWVPHSPHAQPTQFRIFRLFQSVCVLSCSVMSDPLQPHGLQPIRLHCAWGFSRQEYWSGVAMPSYRGSSQPRD